MFATELPKNADVVIIGCGVIGCAIARKLSRYKTNVVALERELDVGLWVSRGNMGVVHPFIPHKGKWKTWMCLEGNKRFDELSRKLDFPFERPGLLVVAMSRFSSFVLKIAYFYLKYIKKISCRWISRRELFELEPNINRKARSAILVPSAGVTDPVRYTIALAENAAMNGVKIVVGAEVLDIKKIGDLFHIRTNKGTIAARYVINASGLSSDIIEGLLGIKKRKMWHGKGVMVVFDKNLSHMYDHIIAPLPLRVDPKTKGGAIIVDPYGYAIWGPNLMEAKSKYDESVTAEDIQKILSKFGDIIEGFPLNAMIYYYAGVRPVDETSWDFVLGSTEVDGFINAAYILSPGLSASIIIAEKIVEFLRNSGLELEAKNDFVDERKDIKILRDNIEVADKLVKENNGYAKILCPDKLISEAEILEAIERGARTIDSVLIRLGLGRDPNVDPDVIVRIVELLIERGSKEVILNRRGTNVFIGDNQ